MRCIDDGNDREEYDHADHIVDGGKRNQRFGDGTACVVFVHDGERGRGRGGHRK